MNQTASRATGPGFSPELVLAAGGPLLRTWMAANGLPGGASASARVAATPAHVWAVISDVERFADRVPMIRRVRRDKDRVTVELRFKIALFSVGFEFVADAVHREERSLELRGVSGEPRGIRLGFDLTPLAEGAETLLEASAEFDVLSLGWLAKYFLKHHPEIQFGIFPGVALALVESMRRAAEE